MTAADRQQRGREIAEAYFGDDVPDAWREISQDLAELTESAAFGAIWTRPGLGLRDRALLAVGMTAAIGAQPQLAWHTRGALRAGLTPTEIREAVIQVAGFAGFPAAWNAMSTIAPILAAHEGA
jgi:4-carboxymuconolactone decarboxylase